MPFPTIEGLEIQASLGKGSSGEVFRARDTDTGLLVAVKVSHPFAPGSRDYLAFQNEYELHARLRHPNIVHALRFGQLDECRQYYVMRYLDAVPLRKIYEQGGIEPLADVALGVLKALAYAHGQNILHGDLKPSNILATRAGRRRVDRVALADFGHAHFLGRSGSRIVQGTLAFSPPEQLMGGVLDGRSDLYALGISLYEAIVGRPPIGRTTEAELRDAYAETGTSIGDVAPELRPGWVAFIDSLMALDPSERPDSAADAFAEILAILGRTADPAHDAAGQGLTLWPTFRHIGSDDLPKSALALLQEPGPVRTVLVTGEEGIGKSRFADEIVRRAARMGVRVTRADARDPQAGSFGVFRGVHTPDGILDVAGARGPDAESSGVIPPQHLSEAGRERILDALLPKEGDPAQPRLYVFDSLECADLDSLETLKAARARLDPGVVLFVVARSGPDAPFLDDFRGPDVLEIVLHPLEPREIQELVAAHLGSAHVGTAARPPLDEEEMRTLVEWLRNETGGNPGRIEAALLSLARRRAIVRTEGGWRLDAAKLASPDSAHTARGRAVLALRRLPGRLRAQVRAACVAGGDVDELLLGVVAPGHHGAGDFLTESVRAGLCVYAPGPSLSLRFRDPVIAREIAAAVHPDVRRKIHLDVAEALRRVDADGSRAGSVAEHLQKAGETAQARQQYIRAAQARARAGAFLEAGRFFGRAWALYDDAERASLPSFAAEWMSTLFVNGHFDDAVAVSDELLRGVHGADAAGEGAISVQILKGMCLVGAGRRDEGKLVLSGLLACETIARYPELQARALAEVGLCETRGSRREAARASLTAAREVALENSLPQVAGRAELYLGILEWRAGNGEAALAWHARAQEHARGSNAQDLVPAVWGNQAICHWFLLDAVRALRLHRRAAEKYLEQGRRMQAARSYQNLAHIFTEIGRWEEADLAIAAAERLNRSTRTPRQGSYFAYDLARLALYRGRLQEAAQYVEQAIRAAEAVDDRLVLVGHKTLRGLIELDAALPEAAAGTGEECLRTAKEIDYPWGIAKSYYLIGCAERLAGRTKHALVCLDEAARIATEAHEPVILFRVQLARAEILAERGDSATPHELLRECSAFAERVDSRLWHAWVSLSEGKVATRLGQAERASRALGAAYETFVSLGAERRTAETLAAQSEALAELGNTQAARAAAVQARVLHERLGLPIPSWIAAGVPAEPEASTASSRVLGAAGDVCSAIYSLRRLDDVLDRILDITNTYLLTERGVIALADPRTGLLKVRCARNIDRESIGDAVEISRNAIRRAAEDGEIFFSDDALFDDRVSMHESVRRLRIRAMAALPIRRNDELLGALYVDHRGLPDLFGREARDFLRFIARVAAEGIHNAKGHELKDRAMLALRADIDNEEFAFTYTIVGKGKRMQDIFRRGVHAAKQNRTILLQGPTGAGKDHLANVLHEASGRHGDFVTSSPPPNSSLYGADLFGVDPGAATDVHARPGHIDAAQGGTLFLNEIADLPLELQPQLLHFLDTRKYRRVGGTEWHTFDGLIIFATNANLAQRVADGTFREDLLYRLSGFVLDLPPLRERSEDIEDLAAFFLDEFAQAGRPRCVLQKLALQRLIDCRWDGNIRELKACLQRAVDESTTGMIYPHDLDSPSLPPLSGHRITSKAHTLREKLIAHEIRLIIEALQLTGGNVLRAAKYLGVSDAGLHRRIRKFGLHRYTRAGRR